MLDIYDDMASGQALLDAWNAGDLKKGDIALQFSIDSALLCADRPSEAWFFIWVFHNLPPNMQYKKVFVILGAIVPGPSKPWNIDYSCSHCSIILLLCSEKVSLSMILLLVLWFSLVPWWSLELLIALEVPLCQGWLVTVVMQDVTCIATCQAGIVLLTVTTIQP